MASRPLIRLAAVVDGPPVLQTVGPGRPRLNHPLPHLCGAEQYPRAERLHVDLLRVSSALCT